MVMDLLCQNKPSAAAAGPNLIFFLSPDENKLVWFNLLVICMKDILSFRHSNITVQLFFFLFFFLLVVFCKVNGVEFRKLVTNDKVHWGFFVSASSTEGWPVVLCWGFPSGFGIKLKSCHGSLISSLKRSRPHAHTTFFLLRALMAVWHFAA